MIYKNSFNLNLNFRVFFRVKVKRPRKDDRGKKGEGLERGKRQKKKGYGTEWPFRLRIEGSQLVLTSRPPSLFRLCGSLVISKASLNFLLK